jgi:hypothetical protein
MNMYDDANKKWLYEKSLLHEPTEISKRVENLKTLINSLKSRMLLLETNETILHMKIILLQSTQPRENRISFQKSKAGKIFLHIYKLFE